jgi:protein-disulfide isomerase
MSNAPRPSKNERRDAAREKAREERLRQQRRERRNKVVLQLSIGVVILAIVAVVVVVIVNSVRPAGPGPRNMANGGITISGTDFAVVTTGGSDPDATPSPEPTVDGKVKIQIFEDFGCPYCNQFESANSDYIEDLVKGGAAEVQYFPVAILDRSFSDEYSTRAANAAAAVANFSPDAYFDFHKSLYAEQPEEGGAGLSDDRLIELAKEAGATNMADITTAVRDGRFDSWVTTRTAEFSAGEGALAGADIPARAVGSTPTVLVNGQYYTGQPSDADAFGAFVTSVGGTVAATPTPTPTATSGS